VKYSVTPPYSVETYTPEGSLRWERVAKSSAVSNRGGFRKGGRLSLPSLISFPVVSIVTSYLERLAKRPQRARTKTMYLPSLINKLQLDIVAGSSSDDSALCGYPPQLLVREPYTGSLRIHIVCHGGGSKPLRCSNSAGRYSSLM